jgi:hypothetical protein
MATTATLRATLGAMLGTVQTSAQTFTSLVGTVGHGVSMLDRYVTDAHEKQTIDSKADKADYIEAVIARKSQESALRNVEAVQFCAQSEHHLRFYTEANDRFTALLASK